MATHSSILAWRLPMDRGACQGCSPWGCKDLCTTERLSTARISHPSLRYQATPENMAVPLAAFYHVRHTDPIRAFLCQLQVYACDSG